MSMPRLLLAAALIAAAATASAATVTVQQASGRQFRPAIVAIQAGDTVQWVNSDTMPHTTTSGPEGRPDGRFDSGNMDPGDTFSHTFESAGDFPYYCDYHGGMTGRVIVVTGHLVQAVAGRRFDPPALTVNTGDSVTWVNVDSMPHTATSGPEGSPDGRFDSGNLATGATFSHTFAAAGAFPYYCDYHGGMTGSITVQSVTPTAIVLHASKSADRQDVALSWTGGLAPYTVDRAFLADLSDLGPLQSGIGLSSFSDAGAVANPPTLYFYQVR